MSSQNPTLTSLPVELLFQIADHLPPDSLYNFHHTTPQFHYFLRSFLHRRLIEDNHSARDALIWACTIGNPGLVRFLLDYADTIPSHNAIPLNDDIISFISYEGETPLIAAVRGDRESIIRIFRWGDHDPKYAPRKAEPLRSPEKDHREEITRLLLVRGVDFNKMDGNCKVALHYSAQYGDVSICRLLLLCGASAAGFDYGHLTPLHLAVYSNRLETVKMLMEFESVRKTIDNITEDDDTALTIAAAGGCTEIVEILLAHGANLAIYNSVGETALELAVIGGYLQIVKMLLDHGSRPNARNFQGRTPLELAEDHEPENEDICALLREAEYASSNGSSGEGSDIGAELNMVLVIS